MRKNAAGDTGMDFNAIASERRIASRFFVWDYDRRWSAATCFRCFPIHSHSALEVIVITSGEMQVERGGESFTARAGEVLVFNPFEIHHGYVDPEHPRVEYYYLTVELSALQGAIIAPNRAPIADLISQKSFITPIITDAGLVGELSKLLPECAEHYAASQERPSASYLLLGSAARVVGLLLESGVIEKTAASVLSTRKFVRRMNRFIEENYASEIEIEKLLAELSWTQVHFCRVFRHSYGTTFSRYLREYRLQKALTLMVDGTLEGQKLTQIAEQVGFSDYAYFSRAFKEYHGISPSEYLARWMPPAPSDSDG